MHLNTQVSIGRDRLHDFIHVGITPEERLQYVPSLRPPRGASSAYFAMLRDFPRLARLLRLRILGPVCRRSYTANHYFLDVA
ncbi:hypothetical protein DOT79_26100 [Ralstonia pseudosolanacearum]|nr:hypothetical protein DOT79_26100 [Ralstonia pseudosolanacearum]